MCGNSAIGFALSETDHDAASETFGRRDGFQTRSGPNGPASERR